MVDTIKAAVEAACPQTVSCADILAVASLHSSVEVSSFKLPLYCIMRKRKEKQKKEDSDIATGVNYGVCFILELV